MEWLSHLAAFGNEKIIVLCIVIWLVKVLVISLTWLTCLSYQERQDFYFSLCLEVNPKSNKGEKRARIPQDLQLNRPQERNMRWTVTRMTCEIRLKTQKCLT